MGTAKASKDPLPETPFEEAIEELEEIVSEMESDRLPLDKLVESYERGHRLLKTCQSRIDEAEQRIERIAAGVNSEEVELQAFEAASEPPGSPVAAPAAAEAVATPKPKSKPRRPAAPKDDDDEIRLF